MGIVRTTVDDKIYEAASDILSSLGLDLHGAVRIFLQMVVLHKGIPFDLRLTPDQVQTMHTQSETNSEAQEEAHETSFKGGLSNASIQALLASMNKDET